MQYLLFSCVALFSWFSNASAESDDYYLLFTYIDNRVEVYAGDSLIFDSGFIEGNPDLQLQVDFDPNNLKSNTLTVNLLNGEDVEVEQIDRHWEITYEIFKNEEPIEYQSESGDNYETGLVFSMEYDLNDL